MSASLLAREETPPQSITGCAVCAGASAVISLGIAAHDWRQGKRREAVIGGLTAFTWGAGRLASLRHARSVRAIPKRYPKGVRNSGAKNKRYRSKAKKQANGYGRTARRVNRVDFYYGGAVASRSIYGEYGSWRSRRR